MNISTLTQLHSLNIHELRELARFFGVKAPATFPKSELVEKIWAANKSDLVDKKKTNVLEITLQDVIDICTQSPGDLFEDRTGYLDIVDSSYGVVRSYDLLPTLFDAIVVNRFIIKHKLESGDYIKCRVKYYEKKGIWAVYEILEFNNAKKKAFAFSQEDTEVPSTYLFKKHLQYLPSIKFGERVLVDSIAEGRDRFIENFVRPIAADSRLYSMLLSLDNNPENGARLKSIKVNDSLITLFDIESRAQLSAAKLFLARAMRLCEMKENVVMLIDSGDIMLNLANNCQIGAEELEDKLSSFALDYIKNYFGAGRKFREGSLTIFMNISGTRARASGFLRSEFRVYSTQTILVTGTPVSSQE